MTSPRVIVIIGAVHRPQRRHDDVIPACMTTAASLPVQFLAGSDPDLQAAHVRGSRSRLREGVLMTDGASRRTKAIAGGFTTVLV
jgi:hypothetical protein